MAYGGILDLDWTDLEWSGFGSNSGGKDLEAAIGFLYSHLCNFN